MSRPDVAATLRIEAQSLARLSRAHLQSVLAAGEEILECYRVLRKAGRNVVAEVLSGQGTFYEHDHYPEGDVYDPDTHAQYYYHAHRGAVPEHGHFHTFLRAAGMPEDVRPAPYAGPIERPCGEEALSHLVGISMDARGYPLGLFATNRWVTGETWYRGEDVIRMVERFVIDHAHPSWPTNRWITAMLVLFRPQVEWLVRERDRVVHERARADPGVDVFEDRKLEITGYVAVSVEEQIAAVRGALERTTATG